MTHFVAPLKVQQAMDDGANHYLLRHFTAVKQPTSCHFQQLSEEYVELSLLYVVVAESLEPLRRKLVHLHKTQKAIRARQATRVMIPFSLSAQLAAADKKCKELERDARLQLTILRQLAKRMSDVGRF